MNFFFETEIKLENEVVSLIPASKSNYHVLSVIAKSDPKLLQYSPSEIHKEGQLEKYFDIALTGKAAKNRFPFLVFSKVHDQFVGSTSFGNIASFHRRLDIGWTWFGTQFQRTGINRNCKYLMLKHAFEYLNFKRVGFMIDSRNLKSRTAVERIGGTFEGILRSHTLMSDGFRRASCNYSILDDEWPAIKATVFKGYS